MIKCVASVFLVLSLFSCGKKSNAKAQNKCEEVPNEGVIAWESDGTVKYYKPGEFRRATEEASYISLPERDMGPEMITREELKKTLISPVKDPTDYKQWCALNFKNMPVGVGKVLNEIMYYAQEIANKKNVPEDKVPWTCEASYEILMNEKWIAIGYGIETVWPLVPFKNVLRLDVSHNILKDLSPLVLLPNLKKVYANKNSATRDGAIFPLTCPPGIENCTVDRPLKTETEVQVKAQIEDKK